MTHSPSCSCHQFILIFRHNFCLYFTSNFLLIFMSSLWNDHSRITGIHGCSFHKNYFLCVCVLIKVNFFLVSRIFFRLVTCHLQIHCLEEFTFVYFSASLSQISILFFHYHKYQNHCNPKCFRRYFPYLLEDSFWTLKDV